MSLGESLMKPTTMLYRNLMAMDVEESIRSYPLDGVVLLTGCDKTNPASIMGACSANIPSIVVTGGPDAQRATGAVRSSARARTAGTTTRSCAPSRISEGEFTEIENSMSRSNGHCMTMGTASTMACMTEALGLDAAGRGGDPGGRLPSGARRRDGGPADRRARRARHPPDGHPHPRGVRERDPRAARDLGLDQRDHPPDRLRRAARGSTCRLSLFDELCVTTPWLVNLKPAGEQLMEDFYYAGGLPAVLDQIRDLLHLEALTVTGQDAR